MRFSQSAITGALEQAIRDLGMPAGYSAEPFGPSKEMAKLKTAFALAIGLAIVFMYLVLAAQFDRGADELGAVDLHQGEHYTGTH